jgi:hypothetical protein
LLNDIRLRQNHFLKVFIGKRALAKRKAI